MSSRDKSGGASNNSEKCRKRMPYTAADKNGKCVCPIVICDFLTQSAAITICVWSQCTNLCPKHTSGRWSLAYNISTCCKCTGWPIQVASDQRPEVCFGHYTDIGLMISSEFCPRLLHICDMINRNESLVSNIWFSVFNITFLHISNPTFVSIPHYNLTSGSRDMSNSLNFKTL